MPPIHFLTENFEISIPFRNRTLDFPPHKNRTLAEPFEKNYHKHFWACSHHHLLRPAEKTLRKWMTVDDTIMY